MVRFKRSLISPLLLATFSLLASNSLYHSVSVDTQGQLHVVLQSGKEIIPRKLPEQVSFDDPHISPDSQTIGWLVMSPDPNPPQTGYQAAPIPQALVLYQAGHLIHKFATGQIFWDWQFQAGGKQVAYSTGPLHGGATECTLRDVASGRLVATSVANSASAQPAWAQTLRQ